MLKLLQNKKLQSKTSHLNSYFEVSIRLIPKSDKDITKKITHQYADGRRCNIFNKTLANHIQQYIKKGHTP